MFINLLGLYMNRHDYVYETALGGDRIFCGYLFFVYEICSDTKQMKTEHFGQASFILDSTPIPK